MNLKSKFFNSKMANSIWHTKM